MGGLGNQMFQYAIGRTLALDLNTKLKLEISSFEIDFYKRVYKLNCFNLKADIIKSGELESLLNGTKNFRQKNFGYIFNLKQYIQVNENGFNFNENINQVPQKAYLIGYWQSEKYFIKYKNLLKSDFAFKQELKGPNLELAKKIGKTNSICIHFRRLHGFSKTGDSDKQAIDLHGACSMEYYEKSISLITEKIKEPHFFIFSDDFEFAKDNLKLNYPTTYVTNNDDEHCYNDMQLISLCKHHIIANSSFSWWGAWLNQNPNKIIIAPQKWFNDKSIDISDLIPENWIKL